MKEVGNEKIHRKEVGRSTPHHRSKLGGVVMKKPAKPTRQQIRRTFPATVGGLKEVLSQPVDAEIDFDSGSLYVYLNPTDEMFEEEMRKYEADRRAYKEYQIEKQKTRLEKLKKELGE